MIPVKPGVSARWTPQDFFSFEIRILDGAAGKAAKLQRKTKMRAAGTQFNSRRSAGRAGHVAQAFAERIGHHPSRFGKSIAATGAKRKVIALRVPPQKGTIIDD